MSDLIKQVEQLMNLNKGNGIEYDSGVWSSAPMQDINTPASATIANSSAQNYTYNLDEELVWFHGFNGKFANCYSSGTIEEFAYLSSNPLVQGNAITVKELREMARNSGIFLNAISIEQFLHQTEGRKLERKEIPYEESEVPLFDDNCVSGCRPGEHKCGK